MLAILPRCSDDSNHLRGPSTRSGLSAPRVSEWEQENAEVCHDRGKEDAVEAVKDTAVTRKEVARVCTHNGVGV